MLRYYCFLWLACLSFQGLARQTDSIPYSQGYLYYHVYGKGLPVIILSGGPGISCLQEEPVAMELGKKYQCLLLEQRGTGLSQPRVLDSTTINIKEAEEDITRLLNHLHYRQAVIYGHSWGGMLGLSYAVHHPDRVKGLILLGTGEIKFDTVTLKTIAGIFNTRVDSSTVQKIQALTAKVKDNSATAADVESLRKLRLIPYLFDRSLLDTVFEKVKAGGPANTVMSNLVWDDFERLPYDLSRPLKLFNKPLFIVCGKEDPFAFLSYELKLAKPSALLYWLDDSGHFPMYENPVPFYATINKILGKLKSE